MAAKIRRQIGDPSWPAIIRFAIAAQFGALRQLVRDEAPGAAQKVGGGKRKAEKSEGIAAVEMHLGEIRLERNDLLAARERILITPETMQRRAAVAPVLD